MARGYALNRCRCATHGISDNATIFKTILICRLGVADYDAPFPTSSNSHRQLQAAITPTMMNHLQAMRVFLKLAESGSFGRAASSLGVSNAVVTRYVVLLESHLNTRLVNRTTRTLSLTEAGRAYAEGCRQVIDQLESMEAGISTTSAEPTGCLKVVAFAAFSLVGLTPLLRQFLERHPTIKLTVTLLHRPVDLVEEGFDAGIVVPAQVSSSTLINRPLIRIRSIAVASPDYLKVRGTPRTPADLATHTFLAPTADIHGTEWRFATSDGREESVALAPAYAVNNAVMLRQAALANMGVTILPEHHVAADVESGTLVPVLADYRVKDADKELSLVYPGRRHVPAKTRLFVEFTVNWFREQAESTSAAIATYV
jgi:DNA-binding transcriptional LysR family regulator